MPAHVSSGDIPFDIIAFDADDTLWHNESLYSITQDNFKNLLSKYHEADWIDKKLFDTEMRNLKIFGYGIKGFTLSMIETAIELSDGRISGAEIQQIINYAREMLKAPIELLPGVRETIETLAPEIPLMIITKGDLFDQESKIARSGIADFFTHIEILSEKTSAAYQAIFDRHQISPQRFLMIGNSLRSDILPVTALGARAVYIPYHITWEHETIREEDAPSNQYEQLDNISELPRFLMERG